MRPTNFSATIYLLLVFISGVVVGGLGLGFYNQHSAGAKSNPCTPDAVRRRVVDELKSRLNLNPDQVQKVNSILDQTRVRYHSLREKYKPEVQAIQADQVNNIRAILDDKQRGEYEKMRQEREHERKSGERHEKHPPVA
jgi:hypothetical protein